MRRYYIMNLAKSLEGQPYIWGADNPEQGFDCSGFVCYLLAIFDLLPCGRTTAQGLREHYQPITLGIRSGDLVFYGTMDRASHVMMYLGNGMVIGAHGGGHTCVTVADALAVGAKVSIEKCDYRNDVIGYADIEVYAL